MSASSPSPDFPPAAQVLVDFVPDHDFFVGVDSDGCAFDAMDIKHLECFTPCSIKYWDLQPISTLARETAIFVSLHSTTRGLNRWIALKQVLDLLRDRAEVAERGFEVPRVSHRAGARGGVEPVGPSILAGTCGNRFHSSCRAAQTGPSAAPCGGTTERMGVP